MMAITLDIDIECCWFFFLPLEKVCLIPAGSEVTLDKFSSLEAGLDALGTGLG